MGRRLLVVSAQLSHCRTVLRLFDDLAMFVYTKQYGLGAEEEDVFIRWLSVLSNMADQLYYPCEHVAWAADAKVLQVDSARWWTLSTAFWSLSLLLGAVNAHEKPEEGVRSLELESQTVRSCLVGAGNQNQVLYKSSQCPQLLSRLSRLSRPSPAV